ncbi:MAG: heavy-metal-associated domain-containing protein [Myxococcales bacterium]|nr:heavy-metal-associated domain-containing protein [Myxococcales bacterium]
MDPLQKTSPSRPLFVWGTVLVAFGGAFLLWSTPWTKTFASPKHKAAQHTQVKIAITGMHCGGCVESITGALKGIAGVHKAQVTLEPQQAIVSYDPKKASIPQMIAAIEKAGYKAKIAPKTKQAPAKKQPEAKPAVGVQAITLKIAGMSCGGCVARITEALQKTAGVVNVKVSLQPPQAVVSFQSKKTDSKKLAQVIRDAGYRVLP